MDFAGKELPEDISFARRLLIGPDFRGTAFSGETADFGGAEFLGISEFCGADFRRVGAWFVRSKFHGFVGFRKAKFGRSTSFVGAEMKGAAHFQEVVFRGRADFNNSGFRGAVSFADAVFREPPKFFGAELHEDVTFTGVDWRTAEGSYLGTHGDRSKAESAMRAWDRLALIMGRQGKPAERHEFHRLMMRARRCRDGLRSLTSIANWLFDVLSDYGWGIGRAFTWWCIHILAGRCS